MSKPCLAWADQTQPTPALKSVRTEYSRCSRSTAAGPRMAGGSTLNFNIGVLGHVDRSDYNLGCLVGLMSEDPDLQQKYLH